VADKANQWPIGYYGDSGHIANIYGQNPNTQGRDFLRCIGDVPNPGHGVSGGYLSNVESFFVAPHAGRIPGDPKNALFLSLVPGKTDKPVVVAPPEEVEPPIEAGATVTTGSGDPSTGVTTGSGGQGGNDSTGSFGEAQPASCSCSAPGSASTPTSGSLGGLAALGLAIAIVARRREA
jgi:MYXO-CTERM domain-containing protein